MTPLTSSLSMLPSRMAPSKSSPPPSSGGVFLRLRSLLTQPIRLERRGYDWHFVFGPPQRKVGIRTGTDLPERRRKSRTELPSMTAGEVSEVCANLRAMLGGEVGRHPRLPSLALLERALMKNGEHGIDDVPAKKKRMGKDPFTGVERMFAAKPASVKIKTRALKKLKDAAL